MANRHSQTFKLKKWTLIVVCALFMLVIAVFVVICCVFSAQITLRGYQVSFVVMILFAGIIALFIQGLGIKGALMENSSMLMAYAIVSTILTILIVCTVFQGWEYMFVLAFKIAVTALAFSLAFDCRDIEMERAANYEKHLDSGVLHVTLNTGQPALLIQQQPLNAQALQMSGNFTTIIPPVPGASEYRTSAI